MTAKNKVVLVAKDGTETEVSTVSELEKLYGEDKNAIFANLTLKQQYEKFDVELGRNDSMRGFRGWVKDNQDFIPVLQKPSLLKRHTWEAYFNEAREVYDRVVVTYEKHKEELARLYDKSEKLQSEWQDVVDKFNSSFVVPFEVSIKNKKDVVLNKNKPELEFAFKGDRSSAYTPINIDVLAGSKGSILSKGESRALFILCVMFEIESRKRDGKDHLIVLDDIADSFDYRNKYAIIEYLHELSEDSTNGIHMIVMTHNFDFFRAFRSRCSSYRTGDDKAKIAIRTGKGIIKLEPAGTNNEFERLKGEVGTNRKAFLAMIPFARNLLEYSNGTTDVNYLNLTNSLHLKAATASLTLNDIVLSIQATLNSGVDLTAYTTTDLYLDVLNVEVKDILVNGNEMLIEHKIILSMAIRVEVEDYIKREFTKIGAPLTEVSNQTGLWFNEYNQTLGSSNQKALRVLQRAMITTPESIHLNSFMYEPIMDLSIDDLVRLYQDLKAL